MCPGQGHNNNTEPPVRLETGSSWSRVEQSTTKSLHSSFMESKTKVNQVNYSSAKISIPNEL